MKLLWLLLLWFRDGQHLSWSAKIMLFTLLLQLSLLVLAKFSNSISWFVLFKKRVLLDKLLRDCNSLSCIEYHAKTKLVSCYCISSIAIPVFSVSEAALDSFMSWRRIEEEKEMEIRDRDQGRILNLMFFFRSMLKIR